ncbi:SusD family outer membrane protein [Mucinivorans hirudinis]|uniref:SusD family outer membrane protein n=1 Tax=Mucinivorans hirudinis TaxID=1433126 RepID=A0A060RB77_9BACT|nr:SusD family outer membrane protein [Mucinivorans hirudinis]
MKKIYKFLIALTALLWVNVSCNYLDVVPDDVPTIDNAFSDRYTALQFLGTCYWHLPRLAGWSENPAIGGALEVWFPSEGPHFANSINIGRGFQNTSNPLTNYWSGTGGGKNLYAGIRDCNIFLENIDKVKDLSVQERQRWISEIKFLKAYYHFYLIRMYGPIHVVRENLPVHADTEKIRWERQKVDECYAYVFELLNEALMGDYLPLNNEVSAEFGRVTRPVVQSFKAEVAVYFASPLFNGNTEMVAFVDHDGKPFFNQTFDANRWKEAVKQCEEAIQICHSAGISLYQPSDYQTQYQISDITRLNVALRNSVSDRWNKETIWGLSTHVMDWGFQQACQPRFEASEMKPAKSYYGITMNVAELFYTENGVPLNEDTDSKYSRDNLYTTRTAGEKDKYYFSVGEQSATLNFDREPRFYSTLSFDRGKWYGAGRLSDDVNTWVVKARYGEVSSVANPGEYSATGYWPKKLVNVKSEFKDPNTYTAETYPFPAMRLAALYLYYAEALLESDAPLADVQMWVDKIRSRAGLKGVVESWQNHSTNPALPTMKSGMRRIVHRERNIELSCEGYYYWDVRRWKSAPEELNRPIKGWNVLTTALADYYSVKTLHNQTFYPRDYFSPIPEKEIINNPKLIQNPGW